MVKQGGWSFNSASDKKGIKGNFRCAVCGRAYKQEWTRNNHERSCKEYNKI